MKTLNEIMDLCPDSYDKESFANGYLKGFEKAREELDLTWEDINKIFSLINQILDDDFSEGKTKKEIFEEVLRRYKKTVEDKKRVVGRQGNEQTTTGTSSRVNHPSHYNRHPLGIECIDIIRHYTGDIANAIKYLWRAGLKTEAGMDDVEKQIEDLEKARWYIKDYLKYGKPTIVDNVDDNVKSATGYSCMDVVYGFSDGLIIDSMNRLLHIGFIDGEEQAWGNWRELLVYTWECIDERIDNLRKNNS